MSSRSPFRFLWILGACGVIFAAGLAGGYLLPKTTLAHRAWRELEALGQHATPLDAEPTRTIAFEGIETALSPIEIARIPIGAFAGGGGAIGVVGSEILFATPQGRLGVLHPASGGGFELRPMEAVVPMNRDRLEASAFARDPAFNTNYFRTFGMLPVRRADGRLGLYVSHHRYADGCIEFVVSRASMFESAGSIAVDGASWRTSSSPRPASASRPAGIPLPAIRPEDASREPPRTGCL